MFMHYHALHVSFSSFLCLIFYCDSVSLFSLSLSLSLSFSLLIITLKKSVSSKNPIRHSSSSSFYDSVRFHNEKARDVFFENFSDWAIHLKRWVILSDFPKTPLLGAFSFRGWGSLCEKPSRCPDVFIQEFYSNMHVIDSSVPRFNTVFHGTRIVVTSELIFEVLHVPRVDYLDYPSHYHLFSIFRDELATLFCEKVVL